MRAAVVSAFRKNLDFDHIYFLEWGHVVRAPLHKVYGPLEAGANYATIFGDYAQAQAINWWWITGQYGTETSWLLDELRGRGTPVDITALHFGNIGAAVFCRAFLERFAADIVPSYSNDELRFSVYSRAYGIPLRDNGIKREEAICGNVFFAENSELTRADFDRFMAQQGDVMHPLRILIEGLDDIINP